MVKRNIRLSSPEIGGLWGVYIQETMSTCLLKYFLHHLQMVNLGFATSTVARADVLDFFTKALNQATELYAESTTLMLSKGIYDRPPMITYPEKVEYVKKKILYSSSHGKKETFKCSRTY
ncbi:uncharacterized protein DUF3231 [Bacillus sp. BK006]|nr:uncharacterized protein DUF3231 [Bacillus sp. BK006]